MQPPANQRAVRRHNLGIVLRHVVERTQPAGALSEEIRKVGGPDLVSVEIFDRYEGRGIPERRVSLAFRLVFQRADRTLTDAEVNRVIDRIVAALASRFGAELR